MLGSVVQVHPQLPNRALREAKNVEAEAFSPKVKIAVDEPRIGDIRDHPLCGAAQGTDG